MNLPSMLSLAFLLTTIRRINGCFLWVTSCNSVDSAYLDANNKSHMYISSSAFFLVIYGYGFVLFDNYQATKWTNSFFCFPAVVEVLHYENTSMQ